MQFNNNFGTGYPVPNIGSIGYNNQGGYYTNNYGYNAYNPYQLYQMQQEQLRQQELERQQTIAQQKKLDDVMTKAVMAYSGIKQEDMPNISNKELDDYMLQVYKDTQDYMRVAHIQYKVDKNYKSDPYQRMQEHMKQVQEYNQKFITPDMDLFDFMSNGYKVMQDNQRLEKEAKERDLRQMYNSASYQRLLNMHQGFGKTFSNDFGIDDMEVTLPNHLASEYNNRKREFLNAILNNK